jgi:predicted transcriptional regulator
VQEFRRSESSWLLNLLKKKSINMLANNCASFKSKKENLSQIEIAEMLGIRQAYCSSYEIGNRAIGIGTLVRLADFLRQN